MVSLDRWKFPLWGANIEGNLDVLLLGGILKLLQPPPTKLTKRRRKLPQLKTTHSHD